MTTDENILIEMFERATNPARHDTDHLAVKMFCLIVESNNELVTKAHQLMVKKMHSLNTTEAIRAVELLEECMSKGGLEFQKRTAKFTFLNELIALVLDKHPGPPASIEIKKRIMECLMLWTVMHQDKTKIQEAYDNIKKQVTFSHDSPATKSNSNVREQRSSILGKDDQLVAKLLKQGGGENYKKANLLIQHRFNQEAKRTEFICHLKSELKKFESTMEVLDEMLNSYSSDEAEGENRDIMQELYNTCKGHNEQMARWPDFLGDAEPEFLEDVLNTKELLSAIIQRYKDKFDNEKSSKPNKSTTNTDLLSGLLGGPLPPSNQDLNLSLPNKPEKVNNAMDDLHEIFGGISNDTEKNKPHHPSDLLANLDLLEPISVFEKADKPESTAVTEKEEKKVQGFKELKEIDKLSEELFKQSLNKEQRLLSFKKESEKLTLNDLAKDKMQISLNVSTTPESKTATHMQNNILETLQNPTEDFKDLKANEKESLQKTDFQEQELKKTKTLEDTSKFDGPCLPALKPLAEISINLDEVTPLEEDQRLLLDDDIQVTLNFTVDRPSEHVSVIVMTVTNKTKFHVNDFQFEASVKKPCKVRLLPPTDVSLAPKKPFRPSAPINQVILLLNPTQKPVDLTCIIGYKLGDDPDPIKESVVTKDIPNV